MKCQSSDSLAVSWYMLLVEVLISFPRRWRHYNTNKHYLTTLKIQMAHKSNWSFHSSNLIQFKTAPGFPYISPSHSALRIDKGTILVKFSTNIKKRYILFNSRDTNSALPEVDKVLLHIINCNIRIQ